MTAKKICCCIMLCQMTAILSGVSLLYLAVIVVIPSKTELESGFQVEPVMCTTVQSRDTTDGGRIKILCLEFTCGEWCLSKQSSPCIQITVMPRLNGSQVDLEGCTEIVDTPCSALNVSLTPIRNCKLAECAGMTGLFNCSKIDDNPCREITPAYDCSRQGAMVEDPIDCNQKTCKTRLDGVYVCSNGDCRLLTGLADYTHCTRKCEELELKEPNVVIFSQERLVTAQCSGASSAGNDTISSLNRDRQWQARSRVLFATCTYVHKMPDGIMRLGDCFNATLGDSSSVHQEQSYLNLRRTAQTAYGQQQWLISPEESLRLRNNTLLKINTEGCVNTLVKECTEFFRTHDTDGHDGKTPDRYQCFHSDMIERYVIGKYNPGHTFIYLMVGSLLPSCLFVVSCLCLFICSKSVGVDDSGQLKLVLMKKSDVSGSEL